jgi:DNA-binding NarL/FixJ family response regulator
VLKERHRGEAVKSEENIMGLRRLRAERPETTIVVMSGYREEAVFQNEVAEMPTEFLSKPFSVRHLTTQVREVWDAA